MYSVPPNPTFAAKINLCGPVLLTFFFGLAAGVVGADPVELAVEQRIPEELGRPRASGSAGFTWRSVADLGVVVEAEGG